MQLKRLKRTNSVVGIHPLKYKIPIPLRDLRCTDGVGNLLTFGRIRRPSQIVVLLHGLNDSAKNCAQGVVHKWAKGLPRALIAVPESPERCSWTDEADVGYDWVYTKRDPPWDAWEEHGSKSAYYQASLKEYHRVLRKRCRDLDLWIEMLLAKYGLTDKDVIIAGMSLGAYLSAMVGARRNVRGVIVSGGPCTTEEVRFDTLLPKTSSAAFLAVNGTKDDLVDKSSVENILSRYQCQWHWSKGVGHDFPTEWYRVQLKWMQSLFGEDAT